MRGGKAYKGREEKRQMREGSERSLVCQRYCWRVIIICWCLYSFIGHGEAPGGGSTVFCEGVAAAV